MFGDAAYVANSVGATRAVAYDITAACSGFLFAVNTAALYLHTGHYGTALVVGADALSRWVDWKDRNSCVLFGDGAGAVVMRAAPSDAEAGLLGYEMHSNGAGRCELQLPYDGAPRPLARAASSGCVGRALMGLPSESRTGAPCSGAGAGARCVAGDCMLRPAPGDRTPARDICRRRGGCYALRTLLASSPKFCFRAGL